MKVLRRFNYFDYMKPINEKTRPKINVTITWSDSLSVDDLKKDQLSKLKRGITRLEDVIYIFVGENQKDDEAVDVGLTTRALEVRTYEHLQDKDYLEEYPENQKVYCGKISAGLTVDRELLEQVEGIIIQYLVGNKDYHLCNDAKTQSFHQYYEIGHIENMNRNGDMEELLPMYIPVKD